MTPPSKKVAKELPRQAKESLNTSETTEKRLAAARTEEKAAALPLPRPSTRLRGRGVVPLARTENGSAMRAVSPPSLLWADHPVREPALDHSATVGQFTTIGPACRVSLDDLN